MRSGVRGQRDGECAAGGPCGGLKAPARPVVVIDDDRSWAAALEDLLSAEGYVVEWAGDGVQGLATLERTEPLLVILDVHLPGVGGLDLLRELRRRDGRVPVLMVSADDRAGLMSQAQAEGACAFLRKPLSGELLLTAVRRLTSPGADPPQ